MDVKKCTVCNIKIDEDNYKKDRNICKKCYNINGKKDTINEKKRKTDDSMKNTEKTKIDNVNNNVSTYKNHRHVVIGPSNVGKTYYMLKVLEKIGNQKPIHIITRSPTKSIPKV